jgi:hypothetical protein
MIEFERMVRPYTPAERKVTTPGERETPLGRLARLQTTRTIDEQRYADTVYQHPEVGPHLQRLATIGSASLVAVARSMEVSLGVVPMRGFEVRPVLSYDGSESPVQAFVSREVSETRYHLPA